MSAMGLLRRRNMEESKHTPPVPPRAGSASTPSEARLHCDVANDRLSRRGTEASDPDHGERMATDTTIPDNPFTDGPDGEDSLSSLSRAIQEHLDLKQRNASLDRAMPLDRYSVEDPFENHPLFKSEEQARLEETLDGDVEAPQPVPALPWPGEEHTEEGAALDEGLWGRSRDFDWGD